MRGSVSNSLLRDPRIFRILGANALSYVAVGVTMITVPWLIVQAPGANRSSAMRPRG